MKDITKLQKQILVDRYCRSEEGIKMLNIYEAFTINILASYMGKKNKCWPKQKELARVCRMSESQLKKVLKNLVAKKIIIIKRTKFKNIYSFNEFWLSESDKFLNKAEAASSFEDSSNKTPDSHNRAIPLYINNKNNNRPNLKDYTGGYSAHENGEQPSWLTEITKRNH